VNLDRFIRPSLPAGRTLDIFGGASAGQVSSFASVCIPAMSQAGFRVHVKASDGLPRFGALVAVDSMRHLPKP
jgi:hypothetical protein